MSATVFFNSANELATLTNVFKVGGVATNPTAVTLTITSPTNVVTSPTPTNTTTGTYMADIVSNEAGTWTYQWDGTTAASDTVVGTWEVAETQLGRLYCTVEALKSRLSITNSNSDLELHGACFAASRWLEQYCERTFWRTASGEVRTFVPDDWYCLTLPEFCDLVSVTTLKTDPGGGGTYSTTWTAADYQLLPRNPTAGPETKPYTKVKALGLTFPVFADPAVVRTDSVQITGVFGWPAVPYAIKQAAQLLAAETFRRKDAPLGIAGEGEFTVAIGQNRLAMRYADPYRRNAVLMR